METIDRGRSIPIRSEAGHRFGHRSHLESVMANFILLTAEETRQFDEWRRNLSAERREKTEG